MANVAEKPNPAGSLKSVRRRALGSAGASLVRTGLLREDRPFLRIVEPAVEGVELEGWLERHRDTVDQMLATSGGVLFRGFGIDTVERFEQLLERISKDLADYTYRSTPRTRLSGKIYTSTEYPADQSIPFHNEHSYTTSWPLRIWFGCIVPASSGGETPLADSRRVYESIRPEVRERFADKGVAYVRNYGSGFDLPWQEVFGTEDRGEVEEFCRGTGLEFEWEKGNQLRTRQVCQAVARHPKTGEMVWFNQAHLFHISSMDPDVREFMEMEFGEENLPRNTYFGDGSPISDEDLGHIREVYAQEALVFPWQKGDVVMLDNMLIAHSRTPFTGPRKVVVGMAEEFHGGAAT